MDYRDRLKGFYASREWKSLKEWVRIRDGYMDRVWWMYHDGQARPGTLVHHIIPIEQKPSLALSEENLITTSPETHNQLHNPDGSLSALGLRLKQDMSDSRILRGWSEMVPDKDDHN